MSEPSELPPPDSVTSLELADSEESARPREVVEWDPSASPSEMLDYDLTALESGGGERVAEEWAENASDAADEASPPPDEPAADPPALPLADAPEQLGAVDVSDSLIADQEPIVGESRERSLLVDLARRAPAIELGSSDVVFLAALQLRADRLGTSAFQEAELLEVFDDVASLCESTAEGPKRRSAPALARLRQQRLLVRVDGAGVLRPGEYALTRLATAIVQFFLEEDALTRESLSILTQSLIATLHDVTRSARDASDADSLTSAVAGPLRVTVRELADGIARRQRALDLQQEDFQRSLATMLRSDWFGAIERCESLLTQTGRTLRELNEVLLRDGHRVHALLQELRELARDADALEAENVIERVSEQMDQITAWGASRQRAWSEYHENVHRFLRDVVRLDPSRALTERLRNQLAGNGTRAFALLVASEPSTIVLRESVDAPEQPPVKRARKPREKEPVTEPVVDRDAELEALVREALQSGASGLADITSQVTAALPEDQRYVSAGRIAEVVARVARAGTPHERPWVPVRDSFLIEEWRVDPERGAP